MTCIDFEGGKSAWRRLDLTWIYLREFIRENPARCLGTHSGGKPVSLGFCGVELQSKQRLSDRISPPLAVTATARRAVPGLDAGSQTHTDPDSNRMSRARGALAVQSGRSKRMEKCWGGSMWRATWIVFFSLLLHSAQAQGKMRERARARSRLFLDLYIF